VAAAAEKLHVIETILASQTFARCDQLKRLLRFVTEAEIQGRAGELTEQDIAIEALGRHPSFDPSLDSSVRNRAWLLRRKLADYYAGEGRVETLRIEIPKGGYVPVFREVCADSSAPVGSVDGETKGLPRVLREVWGPLLLPNGHPVICIATPVHLMLRPDPVRIPRGDPGSEVPELLDWYRSIPSAPPVDKLYIRPSTTSPFWGDCVGAVTVARIFARADCNPEIIQESAFSIAALRDRNAVLFGRCDYSRAVAMLARETPFEIRYWPEIQESAVINRYPADGEPPVYVPSFSTEDRSELAFGLITVMPSKSATPGQYRTVILSGTISPGAQAAAEFLCSPRHLEVFQRALADKDGLKGFPEAYQIVVKAQVHGTMALDVAYATHRIITCQ
jgi:hypothetical protein